MPAPEKVRITSAALHEKDGEIVIRGVIDPSSLKSLQVPVYQREVLSEKKINELMEVLRTGRVPDIFLNMRGQRMTEKDGVFYLLDPTFTVDGLQRITAALRLLASDEKIEPVIGATIYVGKDEPWERKKFEELNIKPTKLSPNVHLRNKKDEVPAMAALFRLTQDNSFVLKGRVQWTQSPTKRDLISASTYAKTVGRLHAYYGPGRGNNVESVINGLTSIMETLGRPTLVANVRAFFDLIEQVWGLSYIEFKDGSGAVVIKAAFLQVLADILSEHEEFWTADNRLLVPAPLVAKFKTFKVHEPTIIQLAGSGGASNSLLYDMMLKKLNSVRRTPLQKRSKFHGDQS